MNVAILIDCWEDDRDSLLSNFVSYIFTTRMVYWHIKRFITSKIIQTVIIASYDNKKTAPIFSNLKKHNLHMLDTDSLESFLISNDVENIFICGCAWDICVRDRPLGYLKVFDLIKKLGLKTNLLVKYNCVKNMDDSYFKLEKNLGWHPTEMPGVFRYGPEELV